MAKLYSNIVKKFDKSPEFVGKELLIRSEILKRDFTKRQVNIVFMIFTFSFAYGKENALIPKLADFELCGVSKTLIKKELEKLEEIKVLTWDRDTNEFEINSPLIWEAPYHYGYSDIRSQELFLLNLKHANIDIDEIVNAIKEEDLNRANETL
jgi:hypothetical protein